MLKRRHDKYSNIILRAERIETQSQMIESERQIQKKWQVIMETTKAKSVNQKEEL